MKSRYLHICIYFIIIHAYFVHLPLLVHKTHTPHVPQNGLVNEDDQLLEAWSVQSPDLNIIEPLCSGN